MMQGKRSRWRKPHAEFSQDPSFAARGSAPGEIPPEHDLVAGLLAEDARSARRELWLGLQLAAAAAALVAAGVGIPLLALAFTIAPLIGVGMEIFDGLRRRRA